MRRHSMCVGSPKIEMSWWTYYTSSRWVQVRFNLDFLFFKIQIIHKFHVSIRFPLTLFKLICYMLTFLHIKFHTLMISMLLQINNLLGPKLFTIHIKIELIFCSLWHKRLSSRMRSISRASFPCFRLILLYFWIICFYGVHAVVYIVLVFLLFASLDFCYCSWLQCFWIWFFYLAGLSVGVFVW